MSPLSSFVVQLLVDLLVSVVIATVNVVVNVENVLDLQRSPSNLHIHPLQSADALHPLETLCHIPS